MKNLLKRVSALTMALLLVFGLCANVTAADAAITFRGFSEGFEFTPGSEYTETDLFNNFKGVMPGDVLTEEITFTNAATDCDFAQLYLRAEAHDETGNPLSDKVAAEETVASMTEFLAQLSMKVWNGSELLYEASPDQLDGLKENKLLGTFRTGETATLKVELTVPLTLGNEFANRVGEVDWVFHVEAYNESQITVRKIWSDGYAAHAGDSITVNLLKDGKVERSEVLSPANGWVYTFDRLVEGYTWTVEEAKVPEGYTVSYATEGNVTTITNTKDEPTPPPAEPLDITVNKVWSNDKVNERPSSVTVALYNGETVYDTVVLSSANGWTYHWEELDAEGDWQVVEINIPKGYTPSYSVSGNVVTITNTASLIQTGQLNWPIPVFGGLGLLLVIFGVILMRKKKAEAN